MLRKCIAFILLSQGLISQASTPLHNQVKTLSPEESLKTIQVPKGYKLQLVASEPMITEPVDCVWDANGDMYVIEMKTYMQDADGKNQFAKTSRVMKLTDTDGDGTMDKSSAFIEGLMLPRMILPLDDRILVCETNVVDIYSYRDTNGDGKADEKKLWYKGGPRKGNLEHQPSGLIWNVDNWIYMTRSVASFKFVNGKAEKGSRGHMTTQWGLHHDDDGNFATGSSGTEKSFQFFQFPTIYGAVSFPDELEKDFNIVWPIDNIPDTQGARRRLRENNTLNHFTAGCGHTVYRGELMPEFYGNYLVAEPVGRLVRMAKVDTSTGVKQMRNVFPKSELIRSTDANFRPVNLKTGPDGALYVVDMYRGIIQEGNWTRKGTYLRGIIDKYGLDKNKQMGRIYRLVPEDHKAKSPRPNMLKKSSAEIVPYLGRKNGWMRSTARKILILRNEKSVIPQLKKALQDSQNTQEKIEILWTLEGLLALDPEFILTQLQSKDERFGAHVLRVAETWMKKGHEGIVTAYKDILKNSDSSTVLAQAFLSGKKYGLNHLASSLEEFAIKHKKDDVLKHYINQWEKEKESRRKHQEKMDALKGKDPLFEKAMIAGEKHYKTLCFACHGTDGKGTPMAGTDTTLAPPFKGSKRVLGDKSNLIKIALHGLMGPVDGKTYPGAMESLSAQDNEYISNVLTYIRNSWGNSAVLIDEREVNKVRSQYRKRQNPWTLQELQKK